MSDSIDPKYLKPTEILDYEHPRVKDYAANAVGSSTEPVEKAVRLYYAVRDGIRYDPYFPFHKPEHYRASWILEVGRGFCIPKAALLCALGRLCGIPARLGFATVKNHLATQRLISYLGSNVFVFHGFTEFYLEGRWVRSTPAFNRELCQRHDVEPLEFDGKTDSLFQPYNRERQRYMEYVSYHGIFDDVPVDAIVSAWREAYGPEKVASWIEAYDTHGLGSRGDFYAETPLKD